jgi:hypothetical protein
MICERPRPRVSPEPQLLAKRREALPHSPVLGRGDHRVSGGYGQARASRSRLPPRVCDRRLAQCGKASRDDSSENDEAAQAGVRRTSASAARAREGFRREGRGGASQPSDPGCGMSGQQRDARGRFAGDVNSLLRSRAPLRVSNGYPERNQGMNDRLRGIAPPGDESDDSNATPRPLEGLDGGAGRGGVALEPSMNACSVRRASRTKPRCASGHSTSTTAASRWRSRAAETLVVPGRLTHSLASRRAARDSFRRPGGDARPQSRILHFHAPYDVHPPWPWK